MQAFALILLILIFASVIFRGLGKTIVTIIKLFPIAFIIGIIYILVHFIVKYW